jgi:hypothetical protein
MLLELLAEAVNAVADDPTLSVESADDPARLRIGYRVGDQVWYITISEVKKDFPALQAKRDEVRALLAEDPESLELKYRAALLVVAAEPGNAAKRRRTAELITLLGRMRAGYD